MKGLTHQLRTRERAIIVKFLIAIGVIVFGLVIGMTLKRLWKLHKISQEVPLQQYLSYITKFAIIVLNPIVIIGVFWDVNLEEIRLILLPVLGILALVSGGVYALIAARILKVNRAKTGSMFVSSSFTNIGSFGMLFCYVFIGEASLVFAAMYRLFEEFVYYLIFFPIAKMYGEEQHESRKAKQVLLGLVKDPFIMASFLAIVIGGALNFAPIERPDFYSGIIEVLVPLTTLLFVVPIGFNLKPKAVRGYIKECLTVSAIKFVLVPITVTLTAILLGMGQIYDGLVLKVIIILSAMPPAFISLIPPQLYKLDQDLANSSWVFSTAMLIVVLPVLFWIVNII